MEAVFYVCAAVAVVSTMMLITRLNAVHALLYLVVSLLSVAVIFFVLGAPFAAALEVIVYAGAIMVLFVFVVMMLNLGEEAAGQERRWLTPASWWGPGVLCTVLLIELVYAMERAGEATPHGAVSATQVGVRLFGPYVLAVELASMLLLAALVGAYHLGRRQRPRREER